MGLESIIPRSQHHLPDPFPMQRGQVMKPYLVADGLGLRHDLADPVPGFRALLFFHDADPSFSSSATSEITTMASAPSRS